MAFRKIVHHQLSAMLKEMADKRKNAVEEACILVEADAKLLCPVKTGNLKRSLTHAVQHSAKQTEGSVGTNVVYAYYAERYVPYLEPAVDQNKAVIEAKMKEALNP
ncbi:MAG: HK97 gp10 family phage protein [Sporolactobacillus sp.]